MKKSLLFFSLLALAMFTSCDKDDDDDNNNTGGTSELVVPATYQFEDANGNSTVSFSGQAQRLEMLSEIAAYMKTANTSGTSVDAQTLRDMYANSNYTWTDNPGLGMTGSSKQLKNKTAAAPSGTADPSVQEYFEGFMDAIAGLSATTVAGNDNGGPGTGGVVVSTTNPAKQYLQTAQGIEYGQFIEKGLMGAVFYNQIAMNYLGDDEMASDNTTPVDPDNGKYYTEMQHAWDEAYGYFTSEIDYVADGNGTDRFWGKYADKREGVLGSATAIAEAFRKGRAAIDANMMETRDEQIAIIRTELQKVVAGTAIHYLNDAVTDFADHALRNHKLSEAVAFISCLPYGHNPIATQAQVGQWTQALGSDFYNTETASILLLRDQLATAADLEELKEDL